MSFSFILTAGDNIEPFEINRSLSGLWDSMHAFRTYPTIEELYSSTEPFDGWELPWLRIYELYAGVVAINALKPDNHPIYPHLGYDEGDFIGGYWRLIEPGDLKDEENRIFMSAAQADVDFKLAAKVQFIYKQFILNGGEGTAGDWDGYLSVYFWDFLEQFQKWLGDVIKLHEAGKVQVVRFHGG